LFSLFTGLGSVHTLEVFTPSFRSIRYHAHRAYAFVSGGFVTEKVEASLAYRSLGLVEVDAYERMTLSRRNFALVLITKEIANGSVTECNLRSRRVGHEFNRVVHVFEALVSAIELLFGMRENTLLMAHPVLLTSAPSLVMLTYMCLTLTLRQSAVIERTPFPLHVVLLLRTW
jgi:hypothetical protein